MKYPLYIRTLVYSLFFVFISATGVAQNLFSAKFLKTKARSIHIQLTSSPDFYFQTDSLEWIITGSEVMLSKLPIQSLRIELDQDTGLSTQEDSLKQLVLHADLPDAFMPGRYKMEYSFNGKILINQYSMIIPHSQPAPGEQPRVLGSAKLAAIPGEPFEIMGENLGNDLSKVYVKLFDSNHNDSTINAMIQKFGVIYPDFLSKPDANGKQELIFHLPTKDELDYFTTEKGWHPFGNNINGQVRARVFVNHQPSPNFIEFSVIKQSTHQWIRISISLAPALLLFVIIMILVYQRLASNRKQLLASRSGVPYIPRLSFLQQLLLDPASNTYSIAKCQAFAWTVALGAGYLALAISSFIYMNRTKIPEFDISLVWLMGISYGGAVVARTRDSHRPKDMKKRGNPSWKDLFTDSEGISLSRTQHVAFTAIALGLFCFYMADPNVLENGLPQIPSTLLALMGVSQGGYISEKFVKNRLSVWDIHIPNCSLGGSGKDCIEVNASNLTTDKTLTIYGSGFVEGTKVMLDLHEPKSLDVNIASNTVIEAKLAQFTSIGLASLSILTPDGNILSLSNVIEIKKSIKQAALADADQ